MQSELRAYDSADDPENGVTGRDNGVLIWCCQLAAFPSTPSLGLMFTRTLILQIFPIDPLQC